MMATAEERIVILEKRADLLAEERRILTNVIAELRAVLGTPGYADVTDHARRLVAEHQALRDDLNLVPAAREDAERWRSVPLRSIADAIAAWETAGNMDDAMYGIREWYGSMT